MKTTILTQKSLNEFAKCIPSKWRLWGLVCGASAPQTNPLYFVRKRLNLKEGVQFIVVGEGDVVILKAISAPNMESFDALIEQARDQAETAGLKRTDISKAVSKARARK